MLLAGRAPQPSRWMTLGCWQQLKTQSKLKSLYRQAALEMLWGRTQPWPYISLSHRQASRWAKSAQGHPRAKPSKEETVCFSSFSLTFVSNKWNIRLSCWWCALETAPKLLLKVSSGWYSVVVEDLQQLGRSEAVRFCWYHSSSFISFVILCG